MAIEVVKEDGITTITINRPERRNALDLPHMADLAAAWEEFRDDEDARVANEKHQREEAARIAEQKRKDDVEWNMEIQSVKRK